jgi:PAS domain S-box-containing protein
MPLRPAVLALFASVAYYLGAKLGLALTLYPDPVSTLWPPNAIVLATLLLTPTNRWWLILLAVFPAHLAVEIGAGIPTGMVLCWYVSNCSEALIGASIFRRLTARPFLELNSFAQTGAFVISAVFLAPFLSSFLDAWFVQLNHWGHSSYWHVWRLRFFSNVLANLTIVPVIAVAMIGAPVSWQRAAPWRRLEAAMLALVLIVVCGVVFVIEHPSPMSAAQLYAPLPLLLWAAVRFGPKGVSASVLTFAFLAIWGASRGLGPLVSELPSENALSIQLFLIMMSIPLLTLAAVMEERRGAAAQVRQSEETLHLALSAAQLGTWDWDIQNDRASWSHSASRIFGISDSDRVMTMERFSTFVHPDDRDSVARIIASSIEKCAPFEVEFRIVRPDGALRWVLSKGRPVCDDSGVAVRMIGVKVDVTERKQAEAEAERHRRELAHLGRVALVGELSGTLAHELNQPLAAILANARAGQRFLTHDPPDLNQVDEILGAIVDDDRRAGDVIRRLRSLLKKDDGRREWLDVNAVVNDVVGIAHSDLIAREISISQTLDPELPRIVGDPVQLQQVMLNLVLNACDAMQATAVGMRRLTLSTASADGDGVRVTVSDTGPGVRPDHVEQIFEPFVTSKAQGLGLGLAICRSIVTAHDGRLWVENNQERGASFHLILPVSAADALPVAEHHTVP